MKLYISLVFISVCFIACSQDRGPGYRFDLFKNTPNWVLAKAVEAEDSIGIINELKNKDVDINLQDFKLKRTLLLLAIGNDKLISTRILLAKGARLDLCGTSGVYPINEATDQIRWRKNSYEIIKLLLKYGANPNEKQLEINGKDSFCVLVPIMRAAQNLACAKLLLDYGANIYIHDSLNYQFWSTILIFHRDDYLYTARYLIIDKKMPIPHPIDALYVSNTKKTFDIFYYLNTLDVSFDTKKQKAKQEILDYLKKIDFPHNQVYKDSTTLKK